MATTAPKRQKTTIAQPLPPLPSKLELLKTFRQYCQQISQLRPVLFNYFPNDPNNPYSLPASISRILYHENLVDIWGQSVIQNQNLLNDPHYQLILESKIFVALTHHTIGVNYLKCLSELRQDDNLKNLRVAKQWNTAIQFICEDMAREAAIVFAASYYPHHFANSNTFPNLERANLAAKVAIKDFIDKNTNLHYEFVDLFLQPTKISSTQKINIVQKTINAISEMSRIDPIPQAFLISVSRQPKLTINLHYPD